MTNRDKGVMLPDWHESRKFTVHKSSLANSNKVSKKTPFLCKFLNSIALFAVLFLFCTQVTRTDSKRRPTDT